MGAPRCQGVRVHAEILGAEALSGCVTHGEQLQDHSGPQAGALRLLAPLRAPAGWRGVLEAQPPDALLQPD